MQVIVRPTMDDAAELAAMIIADAVRAKPETVLGLATGRTMVQVYANLCKWFKDGTVDFSKCKSFNLDEYEGLAPEDQRSYRFTMNDLLFNHINIDKANTHVPDGRAKDPAAACAAYEDAMKAAGGVDIQLLGIGEDGHIGFNEPLSSFASRTRRVCLTRDTAVQNSALCGGVENVPSGAFTMGVGTILDAKRTLMVITGKNKADIAAKFIEGPVTAMISASALHFHPDCVVILDDAAAAKLRMRDFYDFNFSTSPEWAKYATR